MIEVNNLTKVYSSGKGVFDLSFEIKEGEVFGYLGPNGAGKTTTIRNLLGFIKPDKGDCLINGLGCWQKAAAIQKRLGYLPGEIAFFDNMTGKQFLQFMREMRGKTDTGRQDELIDQFDLETDRKIRKMSKGMKQKLGIVAAFMHDPAIYILDEPTSGLDPLMQNRFIELILSEKQRGKTILMSSHSFDEIDRTCDRAGIIREGRLVAVEDIHSLKAVQRKAFIITLATDQDIATIKNSGLEIKNITNKRVELIVSSDINALIAVLSRCRLTGLDIGAQNLEQIFMKYYGQEGEKL